MNWPCHRIHDPLGGYGFLLLWTPFTGGRWLAKFDTHGVRMTSRYGFHNCTRSGVY